MRIRNLKRQKEQMSNNSNSIDTFLKFNGISPKIKRSYERLFGSGDDAIIVLEDLKARFNYYGCKPTFDPNVALCNESERRVVTYILGLSKRLSDDNIQVIDSILNRGG